MDLLVGPGRNVAVGDDDILGRGGRRLFDIYIVDLSWGCTPTLVDDGRRLWLLTSDLMEHRVFGCRGILFVRISSSASMTCYLACPD